MAADPSTQLQQIASVGTIDKVTPGQVNGQPATEYLITVDTQKLLASKALAPQLRQYISGSGAKLPPTIKCDTWINSDNLPVKLDINEVISIQGRTIPVTVDMTYTDWGAPVTITVPSPDEVGPLPAH